MAKEDPIKAELLNGKDLPGKTQGWKQNSKERVSQKGKGSRNPVLISS